ncbi:hypothetical protein HY797_03650 [Candidatus Falkowbacteria bacterium]|nr:hypothetical protein [Candidatus Falkowbacteria bacterium]
MATEVKKNSPAGEEKNRKQAEILKVKINKFLINYFNYLIFSLAVVILAVGLFMSAYPKYKQIFKENEEAKNNLQIKYEAKFYYLNSIRNLKKSYQLISEGERAKVAGMVPITSDTGAIISEIESIAVKNSAILTSIRIESQEDGSGRTNLKVGAEEDKAAVAGAFNQLPQGVGLIKIEVNLSSVNYLVLKNIIKSFENNLRLFDIAKIIFNAGGEEALLTIYSYYSPVK